MQQTFVIEGRLCVEVVSGIWREIESLHWEPRTCYEAAMTRNIYLRDELKTLIYKTEHGLVVFHLPGDRKLSIKKMKINYYNLVPACRNVLLSNGLDKGKVNPLNVKFLPNLHKVYICNHVFNSEFVYTNDGTLTGTYIIDTLAIGGIYPHVEFGEISIPW